MTMESSMQPDLFPESWEQILRERNISQSQARVLFEEGLLSFNPALKVQLFAFEIKELTFLKVIYFDSGFSNSVVHTLLHGLKRPYCYSFQEIYWDFGASEWKFMESHPDRFREKIIQEEFPELVCSYLSECENVDSVIEIRNEANKRIDHFLDESHV